MSARDGCVYSLNVNGFDVKAEYTREEAVRILDGTLDALLEIHKNTAAPQRTIAFFAGPPGAGKSTLALSLEKRAHERNLPAFVQSLGLDGFHLKSDRLKNTYIVLDGRRVLLNDIKGASETFDAKGFKEAVEQVKRGGEMIWPVYDRMKHDVSDGGIRVTGDILLIEGNWLLYPGLWEEARKLSSISFSITAPVELLKKRLIQRKMRGGYTFNQALSWYERVDGPNVRAFYKNSRRADRTIEQDEAGRWKLPL